LKKTDKLGILSTRNLDENVWRRESRQIGALNADLILHSRKEPNYPTRRKTKRGRNYSFESIFSRKFLIAKFQNGPFFHFFFEKNIFQKNLKIVKLIDQLI